MKYDKLSSALAYIADKHGKPVFKDERRLFAFLSDCYSGDKSELAALRAAFANNSQKKHIAELIKKRDTTPPVEQDDAVNNTPVSMYEHGETVFAYWAETGYFYPATVNRIQGRQVDILYLDGTPEITNINNLRKYQYALTNMILYANWKKRGNYYRCFVKGFKRGKIVVLYEDGISEKADLVQLAASE